MRGVAFDATALGRQGRRVTTATSSSGPEAPIVVGFTYPEERSAAETLLIHFFHENAAKLGLQLVSMPAATVDEQRVLVDRLVEQHATVLVVVEVVPNDSGLLATLIDRAKAGTPVVCLGAPERCEPPLCTVRSSLRVGQAAVVKHVVDCIGAAGRIAYLGAAGDQEQVEGLREALVRFPDVDLVPAPAHDDDAGNSERARGARLASAVVEDHPGLRAIIAATDELALGAIEAVARSGRSKQVLVTGLGGSSDAMIAIHEGAMTATGLQDAEAMARAALQASIDAVGGTTGSDAVIDLELVTSENVERHAMGHLRKLHELIGGMTRRIDEYRQTVGFLDEVIDNIPLMLFVKEAKDLRIVRINKARAEWFGIKRDDQIGKTAREVYPPELAARIEASDRAVLEGRVDTTLSEEHETQSPRGPRYVMTKKLRISDAHGNPSYLVGVSFDTTERKLAQIALAQRNSELEEAHATLQQHQNKLLIAEKMASIGRLTAGIAHEMNTPLAAVRAAFSELQALVTEYEEAIGDAEVNAEDHMEIAGEMRRAIALASKSAERAAGFVRGIKSQTRDLSAHQLTDFNAVTVVDETLLLLSHALRDADCTATFTHNSDNVELHGSPGRLSQVITNLVTNAIDAMAPLGGGQIHVELDSDGTTTTLSVADTGTGIAPEVASKIFDPMFTTKPFGQGTGLGLSISHDIISADFGGTIEVKSIVGEGATFVLRIGAAKARSS